MVTILFYIFRILSVSINEEPNHALQRTWLSLVAC